MIYDRIQRMIEGEPSDVPVYIHPRFGPMFYIDTGLWEGEVGCYEIFVSGDEELPDLDCCEAARQRLIQMHTTHCEVRSWLAPRLPQGIAASDFEIKSMSFVGPNHAEEYSFELTRKGDEHSIWRLEFVEGRPTSLSRND